MENVRNHVDFELINNPERLQKVIHHPALKHIHYISSDLVGAEKQKAEIVLDKPIYVGFSVLELSKLHMYKFFYDVLKNKYEDKIKLCYTDTDSYVRHVETEDVFKDFREM